jgi:hypothetical protein
LRQKHLYLFTRFHRACKNRALLQRRHAGKNLKRFFSQNEIYHLNHYIFTTELYPIDFPAVAQRAGQSTADYRTEKPLSNETKGRRDSTVVRPSESDAIYQSEKSALFFLFVFIKLKLN